MELLTALGAKADCESVRTLQSKKLDISVYEATTWDLKKLRGALEQSLHDMFAAFAHQIENQVSSKVSLADFNQIFNPDANGQKQAIESAAMRLSRMTDQLEALHEYVSADRLRQHKVADLNASVLDLTRKHNASRNAVTQLISSSENLKEKMQALESGEQQLASHVVELSASLQQFREASELEKVHQEHQHSLITQEVAELQTLSKQMVQSLEQIQHFTRDTLLKSFDAKLKQLRDDLRLELDGLRVAQKQQAQLVNAQLGKESDKLQHYVEQIMLLDARLRALGTRLSAVDDELEAVKGPLATLAANLREENAAILHEIQRSQVCSPRGFLYELVSLCSKLVSACLLCVERVAGDHARLPGAAGERADSGGSDSGFLTSSPAVSAFNSGGWGHNESSVGVHEQEAQAAGAGDGESDQRQQ